MILHNTSSCEYKKVVGDILDKNEGFFTDIESTDEIHIFSHSLKVFIFF